MHGTGNPMTDDCAMARCDIAIRIAAPLPSTAQAFNTNATIALLNCVNDDF
jgi:hypothetical protein